MDWPALTLFLFIIGRMTGCVAFNPLLGRRGIPSMVKAGFILLLSVCVFTITPVPRSFPESMLGLVVVFFLEMFLGYILGLIVNLFFYIPLMAGSIIDMQMGLSMASTYDPSSGIQTTATSNVLNTLMSLLFFVANGHQTLIRIFVTSGRAVPYGAVALGEDLYGAVLEMFIDCTILGIKLAMPILAAELMGQVGMGILMKVIPQINVFVINIDLKLIIGLVLVMLLLVPFSQFLLDAEMQMLVTLQRTLPLMSG